MVSSQLLHSLVFLVAGWLLAILSQSLERLRIRRERTRDLVARTYRLLEDILLQIELVPALRDSDAAQAFPALPGFEVATSSGTLLDPPRLPEDFNGTLALLSEWEAGQGEYALSRKLIAVREIATNSERIYSALRTMANGRNAAAAPERALNTLEVNRVQIKNLVKEVMEELEPLRLTATERFLRRFARKGQEGIPVVPARAA